MALCGNQNCGCAIQSDTLTITGSGTAGSPWQINGAALSDEAVIDAVAAALVAGTGITVTYNDAANTITLTNTGGGITTEAAVDAVALAFAAGSHTNITVTYNDAANSISLTASGGGGGITVEDAVDAVAAAFAAGSHTNITVTYNDAADSISLVASGGGGGITTEDAVDAVAAALVAGNNIDITYNDAANTITVDVEALTTADITGLVAALAALAPIRRTINAQTGTTYAPVVADENTMITLSNAGLITVTMPSNATQPIPVNAEIEFVWWGAGQPSFVAGAGATVNGTPGLKLRSQYSACAAKKMSSNAWLLYGDLAP